MFLAIIAKYNVLNSIEKIESFEYILFTFYFADFQRTFVAKDKQPQSFH